jgi:hypothetical protein
MLDERPARAATKPGLKRNRPAELSVGPRSLRLGSATARSAGRLAQELTRHSALLKELAARYIWWQSPDMAVKFPVRVVAQVMNRGSFEDVRRLAGALGEDDLRAVLDHSEAGQLNARSWCYWHYRLNHAEPGQVPPMPRRRIG